MSRANRAELPDISLVIHFLFQKWLFLLHLRGVILAHGVSSGWANFQLISPMGRADWESIWPYSNLFSTSYNDPEGLGSDRRAESAQRDVDHSQKRLAMCLIVSNVIV